MDFLRLNVPSVYVSPVLCSCPGQNLTTHTSSRIELHSFRKSFHFSHIQGVFCPSRGREICPVKPTFKLSHPRNTHSPGSPPAPPATSLCWLRLHWPLKVGLFRTGSRVLFLPFLYSLPGSSCTFPAAVQIAMNDCHITNYL